MTPSIGRRIAPALWFAGLSSVLAANCWKGFWEGVQGWGVPYWFVDYRDGFVRRGLAGQLFQMVFGRLSVDALTPPVLALHVLTVGALAVASAALAARTCAQIKGAPLLAFFGFGAWVFAAQVWPSLTYNAGYLDPLVVAMAVAAALLFRSGRTIASGVLIALGPFVHEYFVFLIPFVLAAGLSEDQGRARDRIFPIDQAPPGPPPHQFVVLGATGLASAALVIFASDPTASMAQIARMPLAEDAKHVLATVTFTQSVHQSIKQMLALLLQNPAYTAFNGLFFLLPTFAACAGLLFWRSRPSRTNLLQAAAGLFPVAALLVAWDLSRLLVLANITAGFLFLLAARSRVETAPVPSTSAPVRRAGSVAAVISIVLAIGYGGLPLIYAYFQPGPVLFRYPLKVDRSALSQRIKEPLETLWMQQPALSGFSDLACKLTSDKPAGGPDSCSPVVGEGAVLSAPMSLARGAYRLQFVFEPTGACSDGRAAVQIVTPQGRAASAGFRLGGQITAQLDVFFPHRLTVATAQIVGVAGDGCVRVSRLTVSPLPGER
jgi:hypothetical protein